MRLLLIAALLGGPAGALPPREYRSVGAEVLSWTETEGGGQTARLRLENGAFFPPHSHSGEERIRVEKGELVFGAGDGSAPPARYPAGSVVTVAAATRHWFTASGETVVELSSPDRWDLRWGR